MRAIALFALCFLLRSSSFSQPAVPSADSILRFSYSEAAKQNKNVLVIFHASWCVWCHRLDSSLKDFRVKDFFERNFVICHLTVLESGVQKINENRGALEVYKKYAGEKGVSLPFWIVFDKNGRLLADSKSDLEDNIGCPATIEEVQYFVEVLRQTSDINGREEQQVKLVFRKNGQ